jgi:hypothetical protein
MKRRGGRTLADLSDIKLTAILKRWGFRSYPMGKDGNGWAAPRLEQLRADLKAKYPAIEWDDPKAGGWGGVAAHEADKQHAAHQAARDKEAQHVLPH